MRLNILKKIICIVYIYKNIKMPEFKHTIDWHFVKSAQIQLTDPFDKAWYQKELDVIMGRLKEQGYKQCQVTTIFDTNNWKNEFKSAQWIN